MAMNWLKGLVAPAAQFAQQGMQQPGMQGQPDPNMPPVGGSQYGVQQPMQPMQQQPPMQQQAPMDMGGAGYAPMQWSTGTRTQGQAQQGISASTPTNLTGGGVTGGAQSLEQRVIELQNNVDSLALFARTL